MSPRYYYPVCAALHKDVFSIQYFQFSIISQKKRLTFLFYFHSKLLGLNMSEAARSLGKKLCIDDPVVVKMLENFDRPGDAYAAGAYAGADVFEEGLVNNKVRRVPKAGVYACAGLGCARAHWSVCDAEARGPNAGAGVGASVASGVRAYAKAELASASASAGPLKAKVGVAADTGVGVGPDNLEVKVLGTGGSIGRKCEVSFFGSSLSWELW
ncbi:uncharacterized protein V6R79_013129 [Siganus canaliculatus]